MRYVLDFGADNAGLTPPVFGWFRDAFTHVDLPKPTIFQSGGTALTYYFDYDFPVPTSPTTTAVEYGVTLNGVGLTDAIAQPGFVPTRFYLDFGSTNGNQAPPAFTWYRDAVTKAPITPPALTANAAPAWNYFFDAVFPTGTTAIEYGITLNGVELTDVIDAPAVTTGAGGAMTLAQLRDLIRSESDTEDDPNISDPVLTSWINQSRFRLYGKLVTAFGEDYYVSKAQIALDGTTQSVPLPDGTLYGGAPAFFKGELLEVIQGNGASPTTPISLKKFNLRAKNRFNHPQAFIGAPSFFPRYRIVGSNLEFNVLPSAGLTCQLWYAPKLLPLVADADIAEDWNGWLEFVVVDCVIKALSKQERDATVPAARKTELTAELDHEIANRDLGEPNTVIETDGEGAGPFGMGSGAFGGGYW
jgi:hypothetical protein